MPRIERAGFTLNYEVTVGGTGPTLVLVPGLGEQIGTVEFPPEHCAAFAEQGFRVVRTENRDSGHSLPNDPENVPAYDLLEIADDVAAVIDDLGGAPVHLAGASLGGFIVRWLAVRHPEKAASLTVIMSGAGAQEGEGPTIPEAELPGLEKMGERRPRETQIADSVAYWRHLWGSAYPFDEDWVRERVSYGYERSYQPEGTARLLQAAVSTTGLWQAQSAIECPTLVIHGGEDPVFGPDHGEAIAERIKKASLWLDPRMGHTMHEEMWPEMAARVARLAGL